MNISDFLSHFEAVTEDAEGYVVRCPAHSDGHPSLRVFRDTEYKLRLTCRAGCKTEDVIKAVGLPWSALFNVDGDGPRVKVEYPKPVTARHMAALAVYTDKTREQWDGSPAQEYAARRFGVTDEMAERLFLGYSPAGLGGTHIGRALMGYPMLSVPFFSFEGATHGMQGRDLSGELSSRWIGATNPAGHEWGTWAFMDAAGDCDSVAVTEGPGDGLTTCAAGVDAVGIRGASVLKRPDLVRAFVKGIRTLGKRVVVVGDADDAGRKFAESLSKALNRYKVPVHLLTVPQEGWDITDWRASDPARFRDTLLAALDVAPAVLPPKPKRAYKPRKTKQPTASLGAALLPRKDAA